MPCLLCPLPKPACCAPSPNLLPPPPLNLHAHPQVIDVLLKRRMSLGGQLTDTLSSSSLPSDWAADAEHKPRPKPRPKPSVEGRLQELNLHDVESLATYHDEVGVSVMWRAWPRTMMRCV